MESKTLYDEWGHFVGVPDEFIATSEDLSIYARWLFVLLRFYTSRKTRAAFPSYETLQKKMGCSLQTVSNAIKELERTGWLTRQKRFGQSTIYRLVRKEEQSSIEQRTVLYEVENSPLPNREQSSTEQRVTRKKELDRNNQREKSASRPARSASHTLCDDAFLEEIRNAYSHLDFNHVYGKFQTYCEETGKTPTQARCRDWFRRERIVPADVSARPAPVAMTAPADWKARHAKTYGTTATPEGREISNPIFNKNKC